MAQQRVQYGYEATITTTMGLSYICMRDDLEQLKKDAVLMSLLWDCKEAPNKTIAVRIIRIYRVSGFPKQNEGELNVVYRDCIGHAFNGKYYPVRIWSKMKDYWKKAQGFWVVCLERKGLHPMETKTLEHLARHFPKDAAYGTIEVSLRIYRLHHKEA